MKGKPERHPKGWGYEDWIANSDKYCGKLLFFNKGKKFSWHYHKIKDETFYVQSGKVLLRYSMEDDLEKAKEITLEAGDSFYVPPLMRHQVIALADTEIFEFSTEHFEEDSYRIIKGD